MRIRDWSSDVCSSDLLEEVQAKSPGLRRIVWLGTSEPPADAIDYEELIDAADPIPDERPGGDALAGLFYPAGTTGFPKGVMLPHAHLVTGALGSAAWRFVNPCCPFLPAAPFFPRFVITRFMTSGVCAFRSP